MRLGLLGYPLSHSFSARWFAVRGYRYDNFEYADPADFITKIPDDLAGFNVTSPHKQNIIKYLCRLDKVALEVGAVNCVTINKGQLVGYNTDVDGFRQALLPLIDVTHCRAVILGSGGASRAAGYALTQLGILFDVVTRSDDSYQRLQPSKYQIIINATPLGTYPAVDEAPAIDYQSINPHTICFDMVYNPAATLFIERCRKRGAIVINGLTMLNEQAEAALRIFLGR